MEPSGRAPVLSWLGIPAGRKWLDVGCGTGALCAAIVDHCSPSSVAGVEPSEGFLKTAREHLAGRAALHQGSATAIPLDDAAVDVVVSGLVLNFVPDQRAALAEMARVTGSGGTIGAYVWDYAGKMELMRFFWDAAVELNPDAAKAWTKGSVFRCAPPEALVELFACRTEWGRGDGNRHTDAVRKFRRLLAAIFGRPGARARLRHVAR